MKKMLLWLPVLLWCGLIFFLSSIPNLRTEFRFWDLVLRKAAHMTEYAILFLLTRRAVVGSSAAFAGYAGTLAAIFTILYAVSDEFHQSFVPTRGPTVQDVGIDAVGVFAGVILLRWWTGRAPTRQQ